MTSKARSRMIANKVKSEIQAMSLKALESKVFLAVNTPLAESLKEGFAFADEITEDIRESK